MVSYAEKKEWEMLVVMDDIYEFFGIMWPRTIIFQTRDLKPL